MIADATISHDFGDEIAGMPHIRDRHTNAEIENIPWHKTHQKIRKSLYRGVGRPEIIGLAGLVIVLPHGGVVKNAPCSQIGIMDASLSTEEGQLDRRIKII